MFTGLIEELGRLTAITVDPQSGQTIFTVQADKVLEGVALGDSICTNGVCLTVTHFDLAAKKFTVGLSAETLRRTNFSQLQVGNPLNLERSLTPTSKFGGHVVQGHVDTVGKLYKRHVEGDMLVVEIQLGDPQWMMYVVEKGYIALDGTSLTIIAVNDDINTISVMLIQYTQSKIVLSQKKVGDLVNIEVDILGKHFVRSMSLYEKQRQRITKLQQKGQQPSKL